MTQLRARTGPLLPGIALLAIALVLVAGGASGVAAQPQGPAGELRWGGDPEGGSPYVEADPRDPSRVVGFEVDVAALIAAKLGLRPRFQPVQFASIDASVKRGDFLIGLNGIEDTPARRATLAVTVPYYEFREVLTVREADAARFRTLADLRGRRVATLGGTIAYEILLTSQAEGGVVAVSYDDDVHPYSDLALGRVDAVLLDHVLAEKAMRRERGLVTQAEAVAVGHYVGVLDRRNADDARSHRRHPARGDARRHAGVDLHTVGPLERRSAEALRESDRQRGPAASRARPSRHLHRGGALPPGALQGRAHHDRAVVPRDGARRGARRGRGERARLRRSRCCGRR